MLLEWFLSLLAGIFGGPKAARVQWDEDEDEDDEDDDEPDDTHD